jgi:uncharacterized protein YxjI
MNEKDVLYVKGKFFTFTRKKLVQDMDGNLLYTVRNKFWTFFVRKALVYDKDGNQVAFMKKKFWSFHDHYFIDTKLGQIEIRGNILCFDYHISLKGKEIGHVSRKISLRDSFVLDLDDEYKKELPFFVALVIAIDNITDQRRDDNSNNY